MLLINCLGIILSGYLIWKVTNQFEIAANFLGRHMKEGIKGATINAIGSSLPELMTTLLALMVYQDKEGFVFGLGTTAGSAIFNISMIPALSILMIVYMGFSNSIQISNKVILRDGLFLLAAEYYLIYALKDQNMGIFDGIMLMLIYALYLLILSLHL